MSVMSPELLFCGLFLIRYVRLVVHIIAYNLYKPTPVLQNPRYRRTDATIIIPTVEPENPDFDECIRSVLKNQPSKIIVVTVGEKCFQDADRHCKQVLEDFNASNPLAKTTIEVIKASEANKRVQLATAIRGVSTEITVWVDDHVFWPSEDFLPAAMAPFEDAKVGIAGMNKRVRRVDQGTLFKNFWNFLGCLYLERHNFEITATNYVDGGAFVVSGRTSLHRSTVIQDPKFLRAFTNEYCLFGWVGPINPDDDNFVTRWNVTNGYKVAFQNSEDSTIETTLGEYPKFLLQCFRWVRTTWRSNPCSLFTDRTVWRAQPWCVYAVYLTSLFNFALFIDTALVYLLHNSKWSSTVHLVMLSCWIVASKMAKIVPHFKRHPSDLMFFPGQVVFGYVHTFIKLWALFTFWDVGWGTRDLAKVEEDGVEVGVKDETDPLLGLGSGDEDSGSFVI
ncbi:nucleotide-diphospho-sugar transferase [Venturia nashicola]|uniref:Nucleotide-diphospho-sugar transferase n=1 Tax=Venturia nashicola TaxID=86259 RepID=A0A4Z1NQH1_9PEZI|nr:nucleotide-diphospho-sugar transferase [Venturia nashicola]